MTQHNMPNPDYNKHDLYKWQVAMGEPVTAMTGLEKIINIYSESWEIVGHMHRMKMFYACELGLTDRVRELIQMGADVNTYSKLLGSCIYVAIQEGHIEIVEMLIDNGVDINSNQNDDSLLADALYCRQWDIAKLLIDRGADVHAGDKKWHLTNAVKGNDVELMEKLMAAGLDINIVNESYPYPLHSAIQNNSREDNIDMIEFLIKKGLDVNKRDKQGYSALMYAAEYGRTDVVELLLKHGAKVDDSRILRTAVRDNLTDIVKMLQDWQENQH